MTLGSLPTGARKRGGSYHVYVFQAQAYRIPNHCHRDTFSRLNWHHFAGRCFTTGIRLFRRRGRSWWTAWNMVRDWLINSSGTAELNPFAKGWDPELGQPATVHDRFIATDEQGSITFRGQGHSALVVNDNGDTIPGYDINWVIVSGTGAYADLHGQGSGYAYIDWVEFEFLAFQCGQVHYDPQ